MTQNRSHPRYNVKNTPTLVKCKLCDRHFRNKPSLNTHVRDCHDGDQARLTPLKCHKGGCTTACWSRPYFMKQLAKHGYHASAAAHIVDRVGLGAGPSVTPYSLSDTPEESGAGDGAYTCLECEETFVTLVDLNVHFEVYQDDSSSSSMSAGDHDSEDSFYDAESSAQSTSMEGVGRQTNGGVQEEEKEANNVTATVVVKKLDQLKQDLDSASGSHHITKFVLRFLKPVTVEKGSGNEIAVYVPKLKEEVTGGDF
ncbi:hypothetical protein BG003_007238 [Podila horticola]|nr:hypothetical protein BG003_007238 [Podila horticola]